MTSAANSPSFHRQQRLDCSFSEALTEVEIKAILTTLPNFTSVNSQIFFSLFFFATLPIIFFSSGHNLFFLLCITNCSMLGLFLPCCHGDVNPCPAENCHLTCRGCCLVVKTSSRSCQRGDDRKSTKKKKKARNQLEHLLFVTSWVC